MVISKEILVNAAKQAGQWLLDNQIKNSNDANKGRFLYCCNLKTDYSELSTSWQSGIGIIALLWLYNATKEEKYLTSAKLAAGYLFSLQIDNSSNPAVFGAFREETPQTQWSHPRDAVTAAWAMLSLNQMTGEKKYLDSAVKFADWHLANAWYKGWPKATVLLGSHPELPRHNYKIHLNCQTGSAAFYMQLAKITGQDKYLQKAAIPILDYYTNIFLDPLGFPCVVYDSETQKTERDIEPSQLATDGFHGFNSDWMQMHRFNDDFAALALLQGYMDTDKKQYIQRANAYADWLIKNQNENGSFGLPSVEAASSVVPIFLIDLQKIISDGRYTNAIENALSHLLSLQQQSSNKKINGAMFCLSNTCRYEPETWVNIRNTSYGIVALLKKASFNGPAYQTFVDSL